MTRDDVRSTCTTEELLPLVYQELRSLAAAKLKHEKPGHTLQPTALVHEVFLRLGGDAAGWESRGHFFSAAATAMRRILIENARRKNGATRGGNRQRVELQEDLVAFDSDHERLVELDDGLVALEEIDPTAARVAELRVFAGLSIQDTAETLGMPPTTTFREWQFAAAWLKSRLS